MDAGVGLGNSMSESIEQRKAIPRALAKSAAKAFAIDAKVRSPNNYLPFDNSNALEVGVAVVVAGNRASYFLLPEMIGPVCS